MAKRRANTVTPVCVCQLLVMPTGTFKWAVIINDRGSTCACPFTASLSCVHTKLPTDIKRTHKSEYSTQRVWSQAVKFVRLSTTKLQNLWKFSNYLLKPQGKKEFQHSEKPSSLLSISARLSLLFCYTAAKIFFSEKSFSAVSEFMPQHFIDVVKSKVFGLPEHFLRNIQQSSCWRRQPFWPFNRLIWFRIYVCFFGQSGTSFHCRYFVSSMTSFLE